MTKLRQDRQYGDWTVESYIASGGSGDVFRAFRNGHPGAIKFLRKNFWAGARYERFRSEVEAMQHCNDVPGVLPLLDVNCPDGPCVSNSPWFVMGLAEPLATALGPRARVRDVITACADIAETLAAIHERGFAHRDVKPGNLFRFDGRYAVGDFGLVDYAGKREITGDERSLGPIHFIAPEMLNHPSDADGQRADVYSFAKTIWVLATGQNYPLPGVLDSTIPAMTLSANVADSEASLLNRLLETATQFEPSARPSMRALAAELRAWLAPPTLVDRDHDLDLSAFAQTIASKNELHYAREQTSRREQERITSDGMRLRKMVEPTARRLLDALTDAHFLTPRLTIENVHWGFSLAGHVLATARLGEVTLNLSLAIAIPGEGYGGDNIRVDCCYAVSFYEGDKSTEEVFWRTTTTFTPGGSIEQQEMLRVLDDVIANFRPVVQRVLDLSDGRP